MDELKPCPFCEGGIKELDRGGYDERFDEGVCMDLAWECGKPRIIATGYYDGGFICGVARVEIRFCPFCGRRLVDHADE